MTVKDGHSGGTSLDTPQAFLREVLLNGPVTRPEIAHRLGLNAGTVSRIARPLIDAGLVFERMERPGERPVRPGRRFQLLEIDPRGGFVLGIAIAPVFQTVALADLGRNIIAGSELRIEPIADTDRVIRSLVQESRRLIGSHLRDRSRLLAGSVMVTAVVDPELGSIRNAPYLGWGEVRLGARLAELLDVAMQVRTLMPTIARAEMLFGVARGRSNILGMLCGLGIGTAMLLDGREVGDSRFPTGGIGMMTMTDEDGSAATLDDLAGGLGILWRLHGRHPGSGPLSTINDALDNAIERDRSGDPQVAAEMARAGRELGRLVVQHGHFARPEIVLVAGNLALAPSYMAAIQHGVNEGMKRPIEVVASRAADARGGWWASCSMAVYDHLVGR